MDIRAVVVCVLLVLSPAAVAQIHSSTGPKPKPLAPVPKPHHNSMANSTTPFNCEDQRWPKHPHPGMKAFCDRLEARTLQDEAHRAGRPGPSADVVRLPSLGSDGARRSGFACVGGQAMRKLPNGWAQVSAPSGGWQRCREE